MKKILLVWIMVISVVIGVGVGYGLISHFVPKQSPVLSYSQTNSAPVINHTSTNEVVPTAVPLTPSQAIVPQKLIIPKIGVNADIEKVGLDQKKNMDVPKAAMNVGWYSLGYKVGEVGNAVMAGHLDRKDGSAAVFYNLTKLNIGDQYTVVGEDGRTLTFKVTGKKTYDTDSFPVADVFGSTDKVRLNLITCSGDWDKGAQSYNKRTVINSEMI